MDWAKNCLICSKELCKYVDELKKTKKVKTLKEAFKKIEKETAGQIPLKRAKGVYDYEKRKVKNLTSSQKTQQSKGIGENVIFNETNENIEWARWTWNPVTGCKHNCEYCYARDIANRFYKRGFKPTFHKHRLKAPQKTQRPQKDNIKCDSCKRTIKWSEQGSKNVFVCSMADLFGDWVPQEWINQVLNSVREAPQWNFLFLTKNPKRLVDIQWPKNAWVGATIDTQERVKPTEEAFKKFDVTVKFVSCEPLLENIVFNNIDIFNWLIIGRRSRNSQGNEIQPDKKWVLDLIVQAYKADVKVYCKPHLTSLIKEYPKG